MTVELVAPAHAAPRQAPPRDSYHPVFRLGDLFRLATERIQEDALLDAYLAVASICQVLADHAHRDIADLRRIRKYARRLRRPLGLATSSALGAAEAGARAVAAGREHQVEARLDALERIAAELARTLWGREGVTPVGLVQRWSALSSPDGMPVHDIAIPPRCFFTFDQRPEDCIELALRHGERRGDPGRPVVVVGVRTSGCFMAPIVAAGLERAGYTDVTWMSWRPGQPVTGRDHALLDRARRLRAEVLVCDDPPTSGGSLARTAGDVVAAGIESSAVTLLLPLLAGPRRWEQRLAAWPQERLEWREWAIHRVLSEPAVQGALSELMGGALTTTARLDAGEDQPGARKHIRARYRVQVETPDGGVATHEVLGTGVGLGLFADSAAAVARRLDGLIPHVYGVHDGVMYREWLPEETAVDETDPEQRAMVARAVATYAAERRRLLPVPDDVSAAVSGHDAAWETAAGWIGTAYGRLALPLRPLLHAAARKLTRTAQPSLVDGAMGPGQWFGGGARLLKAEFAEATFTYQLPMSYDAAYDVAAAAAQRLPDDSFGELARAGFEAAVGAPIDDVRWFLYQVVSELDRRGSILRAGDGTDSLRRRLIELVTDGERRSASIHRRFAARHTIGAVATNRGGEIVAIDVDGVLEGGPWWYPAPSRSSLLAVRALIRHGYRPVIATGRSLGETAARCRDYRMAGAVAEYGCVIHDAGRERSRVLVDGDEIEDLRLVRLALKRTPGVELDPGFECAVRAFTIAKGRRVGLSADVAAAAVAEAGLAERIRIEPGWAQTDFVPIEVDKRTGLQALIRELGGDGDPALALAVGDSTPDLAMFRLARMKVVPANARPGLEDQTGAVRSRHACGDGLADAVRMLIGHRPGSCAECAAPAAPDGRTALLIALLDAADLRGARKLLSAARAWRALGRT